MEPYYHDDAITIYNGDCLSVCRELSDESVYCVVTSPPYWGIRDYNIDGQIGLEKNLFDYIEKIVTIFGEIRRTLKNDGTLWINLGDTYASGKGTCFNPGGGYNSFQKDAKENNQYPLDRLNVSDLRKINLKPKDIVGIPWLTAFALRNDGWYLRSDIIWAKPNPMPESVTDRCTKSHEYIFMLSKSREYYFDADAIKEHASYNTHERQARAKEGHKSNPDDKKNGIRVPKAMKTPVGWDTGPGSHDGKIGRYPKIKNNESFNAAMAVMPETRNKRDVWVVPTYGYPDAHFATYPPDLIKDCILAGCPVGGTVLDPFAGSGTTLMVAQNLGRKAIGIELHPDYCKLIMKRAAQTALII